jgi:hypothetical protein
LNRNEILTELFRDDRVNKCCKRFSPRFADDLKQDTFCALIQKGDLIHRLHRDGTLFFYTVSVIRNLARTHNRKVPPSELPDLPDILEPEDITDQVIEIFNQLDETFGTNTYSGMIQAVITYGNRNAAAKALRLPMRTFYREMEKVREHFKNKLCGAILYTCFFALACHG